MNILDKIVLNKKKEVAQAKRILPLGILKTRLAKKKREIIFFSKTNKLQLIAEIKFASPSRAVVRKQTKVGQLAKNFEKQGASAISVLTDKKFFKGSAKKLSIAKKTTSLPVLRKDFICDQYQLYETAAMGADMVLLIAAILKSRTAGFVKLAMQLNLQPLIEVHNKAELRQVLQTIPANRKILIGVNNRNLKTFKISLQTSLDLIKLIPSDFIRISEIGVTNVPQLKALRRAGFDAVLIGGGLADNPALFKYFKHEKH